MPERAKRPELALLEKIDELESRLRKLERRTALSYVVFGVRTDLPSGKGPRAQYGLLADGVHYGYEMWSAAGAHTVVAQT